MQSYAKSQREEETKKSQQVLKKRNNEDQENSIRYYISMLFPFELNVQTLWPTVILIKQMNFHIDAEVQVCLRREKVASWKWNQGVGTCYCLGFCAFVFLTAFQSLTSVHANQAGCQMPLCQFIRTKRISSERVQICNPRPCLAHIWDMTLIIQFVLLDYCSMQFTVA